jgi:replicative DNA helicase
MNSYNLDHVILKTLITNKKYAIDFSTECDTSLFSPDTWHFANIITSYIKMYKEIPTLRVITEKLSKNKTSIKQIEYITNLWNQLEQIDYNEIEFKHDLLKLKDRFAKKHIIDIKQSLLNTNDDDIDISKITTDMQKAYQIIKSLDKVKSYDRKTLKDAVSGFREEYNAKLNDPTFDRGIYTGYSYFDSVTDGLRPGELVLIGAESGGGKSMLLMNMAIQIWMNQNNMHMEDNWSSGNSILYFSLEMPFKPCLNRVLSRLSGCPSKKIRTASLDPGEADKLKKTLKFIQKYPFQFEIVDIPRGATMESLEQIYEEAKANYDPKVIVIDYLGLMDYEGGSNLDDWLKLGKIAERIHEFARVHNCIVLSAVQLNRSKGGKEIEDKIGLHRIGRSALILQNANIAVQIETRQNEKQYPDMNYHIIKNRDGELGKGNLIKNLSCGTLLDNPSEEDDTEFYDRDPDDISLKADLLGI